MTRSQLFRVVCGTVAAWFCVIGSPELALAQVAVPAVPETEAVPESTPVRAEGRMLSEPDDLAERLGQLLEDPALLPAHVGLSVEVAETGEVLFRYHGGKRFVPASNTKIVSAAVALAELGADHTWTTRLVADGPIVGGTLNGNLWIVGGGDPNLTREHLSAWPELLRGAGIERIQGAVIGDDSAFGDPQWGAGWMWDDLYASWGSGVSALQVSPNRAAAWCQAQRSGLRRPHSRVPKGLSYPSSTASRPVLQVPRSDSVSIRHLREASSSWPGGFR